MFGLTITKNHTIELELLKKNIDSLRVEVAGLKRLNKAQSMLVELQTAALELAKTAGSLEAPKKVAVEKVQSSTPAEPKPKRKKSKQKFFYNQYEPLLYNFLLEKEAIGMQIEKLKTFYKSPVKGMPHSTLHRMIAISPRIKKDRRIKKNSTVSKEVWAIAIPENANVDQKSDGKRKDNGYSMTRHAVYMREKRAKKAAEDRESKRVAS